MAHGRNSPIKWRVLDTKTIDKFAQRTWNYVALGHGHDVRWWKEFLSCLSMTG